jgi:hypothetical protein
LPEAFGIAFALNDFKKECGTITNGLGEQAVDRYPVTPSDIFKITQDAHILPMVQNPLQELSPFYSNFHNTFLVLPKIPRRSCEVLQSIQLMLLRCDRYMLNA